MSVAQLFLQRVEKLGLLDDKVLNQLRKQVAEAKGPIAAETLAKILVDNGHLTVFQAKKIVAEVNTFVEVARSLNPKPAAPATPPVAAAADESGLELIEDAPPAPKAAARPAPAVDGLELIADDDGLELLDDAPTPVSKPAPPPATPVKRPEEELELIDEDGLTLLPDSPPSATPTSKRTTSAPAPTSATKSPPTPKPSTPAAKPTEQPKWTAQPEAKVGKKQAAPTSTPSKSTTPTPTPAKKSPSSAAAAPLTPVTPTAGASVPAAPMVDGLTLLGEGDLQVLDDGLTPIDDAGLDPLTGPLTPTAPQPKAAAATGKTKPPGNPWDSALIYVGGGAVLVLIFAAVFLYYTLAAGSASEAFQQAEEEYKAGRYAVANEKYQAFLARYSKDANASLARVRMGVGEMHLAVNEGRDMSAALKVIEDKLHEIESEERFADARAELANMLPIVADRLAQEARRSTGDIAKATELVARAEAALALTNNGAYIPNNFRQLIEGKVNDIVRDVATVKREINRDRELKKAVAAVQQSLAASQTKSAGETLRAFLKAYPGLDRNEEVLQATAAIAAKEQELAAVSSEVLSPAPLESSPLIERVVIDRRGATGDSAGETIAAKVPGAIYGVDRGSGAVMWRHYVGRESTDPLVPVADTPGADVLVVDRRAHDLLRIKVADGSVVWRLPIGEPCFAPTLVDQRALVTTAAGKLIEVDLSTGASQRRVVLPQGAAQQAAFDPRRPHVYQLGEYAHLFVLASESLACVEVVPLGHLPGAIAAPPIATGGQVFVITNTGADYSLVHVFSTDAEGRNLQRRAETVRLAGHVVTRPLVDGRRVYVFTNHGAAHVFDVDPANVNEPVTTVAKMVASRKEPLIGYATVRDGNVWLGDQRLTLYELQPATNELARRWSRFAGETSLAPPQRVADMVISTRLRRTIGDVVVSAVEAADGSDRWQTSTSTPILALVPRGEELLVVNANAAVAVLNQAAGAITEIESRIDTLGNLPLFHRAYAMDGKLLLVPRAGDPQWAVVDLNAKPAKVDWVKFRGEAKLSALPVVLDQGLLLPLDNGEVAYANPSTGEPLTLPFRPALAPGQMPQWQTPLALKAATPTFIIANATGELSLVTRKEQPQPHLALVKTFASGGRLAATAAQLGEQLLVAVTQDRQQRLQPLATSDLTPADALKLSSSIAWGPRTIGQGVLVATDGEGLQCFDATLQLAWQLPLEGAAITGLLEQGESLILTTSRGAILRVDRAGKIAGQFQSQRPLAGDPVLHNDTLWCPGNDGTVYGVPLSALANE